MLSTAFQILVIATFVFFPILLWGYIFSYLDNSPLNTRRFLIGIFAGAISVVPVLFLNDIMSSGFLQSFNIFSTISSHPSSIAVLLSYGVTILSISIFILVACLALFFESLQTGFATFAKNSAFIISFGVIYSLLATLFPSMSSLSRPIQDAVSVGGATFGTLGLVLSYYVLIGVIEETSKHLSVIGSSFMEIDSVKKSVIFSIFIALGFGFIENILYLKSLTDTAGLFGGGFFATWFFRSVFSLLVHILCGAIVGSAFARAFLNSTGSWNYVRIFLGGFIVSLVIHAIFDISLTLGFTSIVFIYFFFGYLTLTKMFYAEER